MKNSPKSIRLLVALLAAAAVTSACGTHPTDTPAQSSRMLTTPVRLTAGEENQNQPQEVSAAEYKSWAADVYNQELTLIHQEQQTLADETAPAPTRAGQITTQLLPQLRQLLAQAQAVQPTDGSVADLHQHLINALQLMISAYQDFATAFTQNDTAVLARGRSELTTEAQELGVWVHGVPQL